mgnify:FL=1
MKTNISATGHVGATVNTESSPNITRDQLIKVMPSKHLVKGITPELVDVINSEPDSDLRRVYKENILGYANVLGEGRFSLAGYVQAVKFVSLKLLGDNSSLAYSKVFPDRYQGLVNKGTATKDIASFANNYSKNTMCTKILEQSLVPTHILNMDLHQEAINVQAELMRSARSETVRQKAAESLIINLKAPETAKIELDIGVSNNTIDDLRATTRALAKQQMDMIKSGISSAKDVAHSELLVNTVEGEYREVDDG